MFLTRLCPRDQSFSVVRLQWSVFPSRQTRRPAPSGRSLHCRPCQTRETDFSVWRPCTHINPSYTQTVYMQFNSNHVHYRTSAVPTPMSKTFQNKHIGPVCNVSSVFLLLSLFWVIKGFSVFYTWSCVLLSSSKWTKMLLTPDRALHEPAGRVGPGSNCTDPLALGEPEAHSAPQDWIRKGMGQNRWKG